MGESAYPTQDPPHRSTIGWPRRASKGPPVNGVGMAPGVCYLVYKLICIIIKGRLISDMSKKPEVQQNPLPVVAVGAIIIGVPMVGLPVFISVIAVNYLTGDPLNFSNAILCGMLSGTAGQIIVQFAKRPLERARNRSVVHGLAPTLIEILPVALICSLSCWMSFNSVEWLYLGCLASMLGLVPLLAINRPWSEGYYEEEYQAKNKEFRETLHSEFQEIRKDIRDKRSRGSG